MNNNYGQRCGGRLAGVPRLTCGGDRHSRGCGHHEGRRVQSGSGYRARPSMSPPFTPLTAQVTAVFVVFDTVALN